MAINQIGAFSRMRIVMSAANCILQQTTSLLLRFSELAAESKRYASGEVNVRAV